LGPDFQENEEGFAPIETPARGDYFKIIHFNGLDALLISSWTLMKPKSGMDKRLGVYAV
jgi:hypothetical protein